MIPSFWKTSLTEVENAYNNANKAIEKRILTESAGKRPVYMLAYGNEKKEIGLANYSSALGAKDKICFAPAGQTPTIILIGAVHGQETEGTAALLNLISLLETGVDLAGNKNKSLLELTEKVRLVIVPVANPDGRARVIPDAMVGLTFEDLRHWGQGNYKDGSLCGWPDCKKTHPMKDYASFLGGYYNDDGVNMMHDNFFHPMAKETQAILDLCTDEAPDFVLQLHGGDNIPGTFLQPSYVPIEVNQTIHTLSKRCQEIGALEDLSFQTLPIPDVAQGDTPPSFDFVCAIHHVCGAISACYESNECIIDNPGPHLTFEQITRMHMILFEECMKMALEK